MAAAALVAPQRLTAATLAALPIVCRTITLEPPEPELSIGERVLSLMLKATCYSAVIDYVAPNQQPVPMGVVVFSPGQSFAKVWFYRPNLNRLLLPRSRRWKRVDAFIWNLTHNPPRTLDELEEAMIGQHTLLPKRHRVFRFHDVGACIDNPNTLLEHLYRKVLMSKTSILDEAKNELEETIEALVCEQCGEEHPRSLPCKPTLHRMILKGVERFDIEDCTYWLEQVNKELPLTKQRLVIKLISRFGSLFSDSHPEHAGQIRRFFGMAEEILDC